VLLLRSLVRQVGDLLGRHSIHVGPVGGLSGEPGEPFRELSGASGFPPRGKKVGGRHGVIEHFPRLRL